MVWVVTWGFRAHLHAQLYSGRPVSGWDLRGERVLDKTVRKPDELREHVRGICEALRVVEKADDLRLRHETARRGYPEAAVSANGHWYLHGVMLRVKAIAWQSDEDVVVKAGASLLVTLGYRPKSGFDEARLLELLDALRYCGLCVTGGVGNFGDVEVALAQKSEDLNPARRRQGLQYSEGVVAPQL
jgi:hypothetical protein